MDDDSLYNLWRASQKLLTQQAESMSLKELAAEMSRRCAEILNVYKGDFQSILEIVNRLHREDKFQHAEDYDLVERSIRLIQGSLEQLAPLNHDRERYEPIEAQTALALLQKRFTRDYPFHAGTIYHVVDTYAGEIKALMDSMSRPCHEAKGGISEGEKDHFDRLYTGIYELMHFAQQAMLIIEGKVQAAGR